MIELKPAGRPTHLKMGIYGGTGSGKTFTSANLLCQFAKQYLGNIRIAMYDSEGGGPYVADLVKEITNQELLVLTSQSFAELVEFADLCRDENYLMFVDSITHPWRDICQQYLEVKKSRVSGAGGNPETTRLALKDWGPIKDTWNDGWANKFRYDPVHACFCAREGDIWESVTDEEGKEELQKTGTKPKTETELGYEPSILVQMKLVGNKHLALVTKDRFHVLTGKSGTEPDIEFFRPYLDLLDLGGKPVQPNPEVDKVFQPGSGKNYQSLADERAALIEGISEDLFLLSPGRSDQAKADRIRMARKMFGPEVTFKSLETNSKLYPNELLANQRKLLQTMLRATNGT